MRLTAEGVIESRPKECKDTIRSIEGWTNAFIIYMSVYISVHTDKAAALLQYMYNIRDCAARQGGLAGKIMMSNLECDRPSTLFPGPPFITSYGGGVCRCAMRNSRRLQQGSRIHAMNSIMVLVTGPPVDSHMFARGVV